MWDYQDTIRDELMRDRFVAGCYNERLREDLLTADDKLTLAEALQRRQASSRSNRSQLMRRSQGLADLSVPMADQHALLTFDEHLD